MCSFVAGADFIELNQILVEWFDTQWEPPQWAITMKTRRGYVHQLSKKKNGSAVNIGEIGCDWKK